MAYQNEKVKARQTVAQNTTQQETLGIVSNVPMGEWNVATQYKKLNIVRSHGASYQAMKDNIGIEPTVTQRWEEVWQLLVHDGRGVVSSEISYQAGVSNSVVPTNEWSNDIPNVPQGQYLWTRTIYNFTDGTQNVSYSVSLQGLNFTQQDRDNVDRIVEAIPSSASASNPLTTKDFVNSSINNMAAFYITYNADGDAFSTRADLLSTTIFYSGGKERVPTQNDYAIVLADESQPKGVDGSYPTTRYLYQGGTYPNGQWDFQYVVNNTSLTQAQIDAINSGITNTLVEQITTNKSDIATKASKDVATQTTNGLMSAADKTKLDGLGGSNVTGVKGNSESEYRTGNVNLTSENIGALPISGGTMTGALQLNANGVIQYDGKNYVNTLKAYDDGDEYNYGSEITLTGNGNSFVGAGEAPTVLRTTLQTGVASGEAYTKVAERFYIASDNEIYLYSNGNTIANRLGIAYDNTGSLRPLVTNTRNLGTSTIKWANAYATTFHGALDGNASTATKLANVRTIDGISFDGSANITHFGTCATASTTTAKVVTVASTFTLVAGARVQIKFTYYNYGTATLNVNNTGAKSIRQSNANRPESTDYPCWEMGTTCDFVYDGTYWVMLSSSCVYPVKTYSSTSLTTGQMTLSTSLANAKYIVFNAFRGSYGDYMIGMVPKLVFQQFNSSSKRYVIQINSSAYISFYYVTDLGINLYNMQGVTALDIYLIF